MASVFMFLQNLSMMADVPVAPVAFACDPALAAAVAMRKRFIRFSLKLLRKFLYKRRFPDGAQRTTVLHEQRTSASGLKNILKDSAARWGISLEKRRIAADNEPLHIR